jgi:uncharacterized protein (TIGR03118 family)
VLVLGGSAQAGYFQINLVSNQPGVGIQPPDPQLINAWGISESSGSPFWVSDNRTGVATLYNTQGVKQGLVVTITPPAGQTTASPTGQVFNGSGSATDFLTSPGHPATFIFDTQSGTINAWTGGAGGTGTVAPIEATNANASYVGLTMGVSGGANFLYAANDKGAGSIDVYNGAWTQTALAGNFTDPNLPAGMLPYNIRNITVNGTPTLFVTYFNGPATPGGLVDAFNTDGTFIGRVATNGSLDEPWGLALAPAGFFGPNQVLLVGNLGDGHINVFDPTSFAFLGQLTDPNGNPIAIDGLWGLQFGNGGNGGNPNILYFTAGPNRYTNGLFGELLVSTPEPGTGALLGLGGIIVLAARLRRRHRAA